MPLVYGVGTALNQAELPLVFYVGLFNGGEQRIWGPDTPGQQGHWWRGGDVFSCTQRTFLV